MILRDKYLRIKNNLSPKQGRILIAAPFIEGDIFERSVILLTEYNQDGAVGFIMNKPLDLKINDLFEDPLMKGHQVYFGGPVNSDSAYYIHTLGDQIKGCEKIQDGLYWGGDFDQIQDMLRRDELDDSQIRFFCGYCGWGNLQLDDEINEHDWVVQESDAVQIMESTIDFWDEAVLSLGSRFRTWQLFPRTPSLN